jgi:hypothetical protein
MATTTKVFKSGGSQAVRIPQAYRLEADTVTLDGTPGGLLIFEVSKVASPARGTAKASARRPRQPGFLKGLKGPADFDAPLPKAVLADFGAA